MQLGNLHIHFLSLTNGDFLKVINYKKLDSEIIAAKELQQLINGELKELSRRTKWTFQIYLPREMRLRHVTPMFGFLGEIIGPVAGLLAYDDGQRMKAETEYVMYELHLLSVTQSILGRGSTRPEFPYMLIDRD